MATERGAHRFPSVPGVDVAQPRGPRVRAVAPSANDAQRHPARKVRFYGLDLYSLAARWRRSSGTSMPSIRRRPVAPASAMAVSTTSAAPARPTATPSPTRARCPARTKWSLSWSRCVITRMPTCVATVGSPKTSSSMREQNAVVVRDAEEYYQQMYRAEMSSWNLRDLHGGDARRAGQPSRPPVRSRQGRRVGAQLTRRRRACHGNGITRRAERRSARSPALRHRLCIDRFQHVRGSCHRRVELGRGATTQAGPTRARRELREAAPRRRLRRLLAPDCRPARPRPLATLASSAPSA